MVHGGKSFGERSQPALSARTKAICLERKLALQRLQRNKSLLMLKDVMAPTGCLPTTWTCGKQEQGRPVRFHDGSHFRKGILDKYQQAHY